MGQMALTEQHILRPGHPYYGLVQSFCHMSKNLYNHANYLIRQSFTKDGTWLRYHTLDKLLKADKGFPDYQGMPTAQSAQQTLRVLDQNWKSFFQAMKDWKKHPEKYFGRPKLPKYLKKDGQFVLILTNQNCRLKGRLLHFPKAFQGLTVIPQFLDDPNFLSFQQIRFIPKGQRIVAELVYQVQVPEGKPDNGRIIGIDIGVNNLAAVANTINKPVFVINGKPLKSINQYANKRAAYYQSMLEQTEGRKMSKRLQRIWAKRGRKMKDYMHKASRYIVDTCVRDDIRTIVIGRNKGWKQGSNLGKQENQNFVQIPFYQFIQMIEYKAKKEGIAVILTEEAYTSGTSFMDGERPKKRFYDKSRRVKRGLFITNTGIPVNADINAAYQIIKKVVPIKWDRGCVLHPFVVTQQ